MENTKRTTLAKLLAVFMVVVTVMSLMSVSASAYDTRVLWV